MSLKGILGGIDVDVILNSIVQIRARLGFWAHMFRKPFYYLILSLVAIGRDISLSFMSYPLLPEFGLYFCLR